MSTSATFPLPAYVPPPAEPPPGLVYQPDHAGEAEDRLLVQFDSAARLHALVRTLVKPYQELEQAALTVRDAFDVDAAVGAQLDVVGNLVGERREARSDIAYRAYVKARILANASDGKPTTLYRIARALLGEDVLSLKLTGIYPAHYDMEVAAESLQLPWDPEGEQTPDMVARALADALLLATSAGISLTLYYQFADDDHTFTFSSLATAEEDSVDQGFADASDETGPGGLLIGAEERG
jgi:hypothetical protein